MANQFIARKGLIALADSQITGSLNISQNIVAGGTVQATFDTSTATAISGAFDSVSSSLASDITLNASSISSLNAASSSYLLNTTDTFTGTLSVNGFLKADSSSTGDYVRLYGSSGTGQWDIYGNGENLRFSENSGGGGSVVIDSSLGLGGSPNYPFHISSTSVYQAAIKSTGAQYLLIGSENAGGAGIILDGDSNGDGAGGDYSYIVHENSGVLKIVQDSPAGINQISFGTAGTENRVIIDTNGNLGIGATTLAYRTEVAGNNSAYWNGSSFTGGTPLALSINNTQNGGYDSLLLLQQTDSGGTIKNAGGIGMVGRASWTAGNNATQISDMYFLVRNNSGGVSERMRIDSNGRVGIGTTPSEAGLEIYKNASQGNPSNHTPANATLKIQDSSNQMYLDGNSIIQTGAASFTFGNTQDASILFYTNASEKVRFQSDGNVGIGSTSPTAKLDVNGELKTDQGLYSSYGVYTSGGTYTNQWQKVFELTYTSVYYYNTMKLLVSMTGDTSNVSTNAEVHINLKFQNNNGRINVNIVNFGEHPLTASNFEVYRDSANTKLVFYHRVDRNYSQPIYTLLNHSSLNINWVQSIVGIDLSGEANDGLTEKNIVNSITSQAHTGNVGIGTTSPEAKAHISSDNSGRKVLLESTNTTYSSDAGPELHFKIKQSNDQAATAGYIRGFSANGWAGGLLVHTHNPGLPDDNTTERLRIDSDGLKFNGDTAAANALDDYEEGTWTPVLRGTSGDPAINTVSEYTGGIYTKIGNVVYASFEIRWSSKTGGAGNCFISGLPFTRRATQLPDGDRTIIDSYNNTISGLYLIGGVGTNNTNIGLASVVSGGVTVPFTTAHLGNSNPTFLRGTVTYFV